MSRYYHSTKANPHVTSYSQLVVIPAYFVLVIIFPATLALFLLLLVAVCFCLPLLCPIYPSLLASLTTAPRDSLLAVFFEFINGCDSLNILKDELYDNCQR